MRILGAIVEVLLYVLAALIADVAHRSAVRSELVCHDSLRRTAPFHGFLQEPESCQFIAFLRDIALQDFAFMIDGPPEIMLSSVDLHEDLIKMPLPLGVLAQIR